MESNVDEDDESHTGPVEASNLLAVPMPLHMSSPYRRNNPFVDDGNEEYSSELQHAALLEQMPLVIEMVADVLRNAQNAVDAAEADSTISPILLTEDCTTQNDLIDLTRCDANEEFTAEVSSE